MQVVSWFPADDAANVPLDAAITLRFSDYPDPDSLSTRTMLLTFGPYYVPGQYLVSLLDKTVTLRPFRLLASQLGHTVQVFPGLRSLAGCTVAHASNGFRTGDSTAAGPGQNPDRPLPPQPVTFSEVQATFTARCGGGGCHLAPSQSEGAGDCLAKPAGGLSLCAAESWDSLVNIPSGELNAIPRVEPGNAAQSYLFRKLVPADTDDGRLPGTLGQREPPGPPLDEETLRMIGRWIDAGALR